MTPQEEFDKTRWKTADDMDTHDIEVIMANQDKLNEEEKAAFSSLIQANTPFSDDPLNDAINTAVDQQDPEPGIPGVTPAVVTPVPEVPVAPAPAGTPTFSPEQFDTYLEEKRKQWTAEGKTKADQKEEEKQIKFELFNKDELPEDWNVAVNKFAPAIIEEAEKRVMARLEKQNAEREATFRKINETKEQIFNQFEAEFTDLASKNLIPAKDSKDYQATHDAIVAIGDKYGRKNITEAYDLWAIIPKDKGGGLDAGAPAANANDKMRRQKEAAGKIGSGNGTATPAKRAPDYNTVHSTKMEDLIEQRLQQQ